MHCDECSHSAPRSGLPMYELYRKREHFLAVVFIVVNAITYFLIDYDRLRPVRSIMEQWARDLIAGRFPAPEQYRVAIPALTLALERFAHLQVSQSAPLIEAISYAGTLILLYRLLRLPSSDSDLLPFNDAIRFAFFLAAAQLPILWIFPWERHETLPSAFYLAALVYAVARKNQRNWLVTLALVSVLTLAQSFARTDIPIIVGVALLICAATRVNLDYPRGLIALFGAVSIAIGTCVQLYLEKILYPASRYPAQVPKIQLFHNLNPASPPVHIPVFLTALLPLLVTVGMASRRRTALLASDKAILLMCILYLPVWATVGLLIEVRIFVPFLFLASPVMARVWTAFLFGDRDSELRLAGDETEF